MKGGRQYMKQNLQETGKHKIHFLSVINVFIMITTTLITYLVFWAEDHKYLNELWLRYIDNSSWIDCDRNFSYDGRHFTYEGKEKGTCSVSLESGQFLVGTADSSFQESIFSEMVSDRCAAFVLHGPLQLTFSMDIAGGGDYYFATPYDDAYFNEKWTELDNHISCNRFARGYDKIECNQSGCWIWP